VAVTKYRALFYQLKLGQNYLLLQRSSGKTLSIELGRLPLLQADIPHLRLRLKYLRRLQGGTIKKGTGGERGMALTDKTLVCRDCGREFTFTVGEQESYSYGNRGYRQRPQPLLLFQG